ncbi:S-layer homology domain-containing protein [Trichormus azollae]
MDWAKASILAAGERNILKGYPHATFRPDAPVTRAEFVAII